MKPWLLALPLLLVACNNPPVTPPPVAVADLTGSYAGASTVRILLPPLGLEVGKADVSFIANVKDNKGTLSGTVTSKVKRDDLPESTLDFSGSQKDGVVNVSVTAIACLDGNMQPVIATFKLSGTLNPKTRINLAQASQTVTCQTPANGVQTLDLELQAFALDKQ
jgi:hypothetical protein